MSAPGAPPILVLVGPTGTGKSAAAHALARAIGGEIVGCDAIQVYRGFDVATAKPSEAERSSVAHHLVDCADPASDFSLADYVRAADRAIAGIRGRERVPIVTGGTGLYLRGLLRGVVAAPGRDERLRERLHGLLARGAEPRLRAWLRRHDPASERRIAPRDTQRLVRAIELARGEGPSWGERLAREGTWANGDERYASLKIGLDMDRDRLGARLDERVERFFAAGLVAEVRALVARGVPRGANAFKAIGYREVLAAVECGVDPETTRDEVKRSTRRYAKRQRTWFRREDRVVWLDAACGTEAVVERIGGLWAAAAKGQ